MKERADRGKRRVLVVDDNVDAADVLGEMLEMNDFEVRVSHGGADALELARSFRPEVAFIDLNMPNMGGIDLGKRLQSEKWAQGLTLIALTGMGQPSDVESTRAAGFHAHLVKPACPEDIVRLASGVAPSNVVPIRADMQASGDRTRSAPSLPGDIA